MVAWPDESLFVLHYVDDWVHVHHSPGKEMPPGCTNFSVVIIQTVEGRNNVRF